ncbi:hypothetical protein PH547_14090 [Rhizobium sp. CNPSo 3464]|uniref:hypothetical protein n=1 Tax=Rhizobium sp. CNPSo 3464 TaxID=3021406 RepID=UPI00254D43B9|nr:hypothetical protein [Rhizobium sp. CNPSo 3464]MDK4740013.1 hypothetical protein [Rhizobium sp. CNPSo 3464]
MRVTFIALGVTAAITMGLVSPAIAQVVIHEDQSPDGYDSDRDQTESDFLHAWNRHHDAANRWGERRDNFGPDDVIRLLERRGYHVRNVKDVGVRYLVEATRGNDNLLVSVSRGGEIMGVVHDNRY